MNQTFQNETNLILKKTTSNGLANDIYWTLIIPAIGFFGTLTNLASIFTLIRMGSKNHMYKYMLTNAISNCVYMLLCAFIFFLRCGTMCTTDLSSLGIILYNFLIWDYATSALAILISLVEIIMCIQRYGVISNWNKYKFERFNLIFPVLVMFSLVVYLPRLFFRQIDKVVDGDAISYELVNTRFKSTIFGIVLNIMQSVVRGPVLLVIIIIINILTGLKYAELIRKKIEMTNTFTKNSNFLKHLKMIISKNQRFLAII